MRKINIVPRLSALTTLAREIADMSTAIYTLGYSFGADPVAYWFPSRADQAIADAEDLRDRARRLPSALDARHGSALAALRAALTKAERDLRATRDDYTTALRMAQAMERPGDSYTHVIQLAGDHAVRRATQEAPRWID